MQSLNEEQQNKLIRQYIDTIINLVDRNTGNMSALFLLNSFSEEINDIKRLSELIEKISSNNKLKQSRDFKNLNSFVTGKMNDYNKVGTKTVAFSLPDSTGNYVDVFNRFKGKMVYVERSASWCGQCLKV